MDIFKRLLSACSAIMVTISVGLWLLINPPLTVAGALPASQRGAGAVIISIAAQRSFFQGCVLREACSVHFTQHAIRNTSIVKAKTFLEDFNTITATGRIFPMAIFPPNLGVPANGAIITDSRPAFDWSDVTGAVSYTLRITGESAFSGLSAQVATAGITTTNSIYTPTQSLPNSVYTWTVRAYNAIGEASGYAAPFTFTLQAPPQIFLPIIHKNPQPVCPTTSTAAFQIIPIEGNVARDHPPPLHGDLNLSLRGYSQTNASKTLQDYNGGWDSSAPQLDGVFEPNQFPGISTVYQVNSWNWACGSDGCPGGPITNWPVTMMGLSATAGQKIYIPERGPEIYGGGYKAMVLYAEARRLTLVYTRRDTVVGGYTVHLENICVDPNLLALYQAQTGAQGWHTSGYLPALRNNQALGTALDSEVKVVIRDGSGSFLDPRSRKDWWQNY